jgi:chitodextrinase
MMKSIIIWLIGVCVLACACQKRKYPDEKVQLQKENIFSNGYIDNTPIALKIGVDGYYCYSSYAQRPDSIYMFKGELRKFDCNACPLALQVELSDYKVRLPGASILVDSSLGLGKRIFLPAMPKASKVKFVSLSNKTVASQRWNFSDGTSSQDSILTHEFAQPGVQTVSLTVRTTGNCESVVINKIFVDVEKGVFGCGISAQLLQKNNSQFTSTVIGGKAPYRYTWNFGDGNTSNLSTPSHDYQYAGSYPVKLRIEDADNHVCESNYIHVTGNDKSSCATNMLLSQTGSRKTFFNGARIQWIDQSNIALRSDSITQPTESYFEIIKSEPYAPNERGETGRLLTLRFNVLLYGGNRRVWFKSDNTAIAVTYK